jgi:Xaa-Pro aminopeptidase
MSQGNFPLLSLKERDRRWALVRREMSQRSLDALVICGDQGNWHGNMANVRYVTGIGDMSWAVFPVKAEPILLTWWTSPFEAKRNPQTDSLTARIRAKVKPDLPGRNPWGLEAPWVREVRMGWPRWSQAVLGVLRDLGLERGSIGLVGTSQAIEPEGHFPWKTYAILKEALPHAQFVEDATGILEQARLCKGEEEIRCIEKAAEIADIGIDAMVKAARPGVSEHEVYVRVISAMLEAGSERSVMLYWTSGQTPTHVQLFAPTPRPLREGDLILTEVTPRYAGYVAHPHQPVSIGKPLPEYQMMFDLLLEVRDAALGKLRRGMTVGELEEMLTRPLEEKGYSYLHCPFHGLGLAGLEFPNANFWGRANPIMASPPDMKFEEGMEIAYEPMISTGDRKIGMQLGDTVLITRNGARRLSRYAKELMVAE